MLHVLTCKSIRTKTEYNARCETATNIFQFLLSEKQMVGKILRCRGIAIRPRQVTNTVSARFRVSGFTDYVREVMAKMSVDGFGYYDGDSQFIKNVDLNADLLHQYAMTIEEYRCSLV